MFACTAKAEELRQRLLRFMDEHIYPNEAALLEHEQGPDRWQPPALVETLKEKARAEGLWNLFLPESEHGAGLSNLDYAHLCEIMGRSPFAPEVFNCAAPDTGNMEVLARLRHRRAEAALAAAPAGRRDPLLLFHDRARGRLLGRTNIECSIRRDGDDYVINGRKWWSSGAMDPRCRIAIVMGKTNPAEKRYRQQSMILVPLDPPE